MELRGEHVVLRPMTLKERYKFYRWATQSDAAPFWYGDLYGDEIPSYIAFKLEFPDFYFDGSAPEKGRAFAIMYYGRTIGQINYNEIEEKDHSVELDVIIAKQQNQNRGLGSDAIKTLLTYLFTHMNIRRCRIEVLAKNPRAIRAFEKVGFEQIYTYSRRGIVWQVMECISTIEPDIPKAREEARKSGSELSLSK